MLGGNLRITIDKVPNKPVDLVPVTPLSELTGKPLEYVQVPKKPDDISMKVDDYWNILKGFFQQQSLQALGLESSGNIKTILLISLAIIGGLIFLVKCG